MVYLGGLKKKLSKISDINLIKGMLTGEKKENFKFYCVFLLYK